jgi:hypothetical protein
MNIQIKDSAKNIFYVSVPAAYLKVQALHSCETGGNADPAT